MISIPIKQQVGLIYDLEGAFLSSGVFSKLLAYSLCRAEFTAKISNEVR